MTAVERVTTLHEATVQDAELHAARLARARRPRAQEKGRSSKPKVKVKVDKRVMAEARKLLQARPGTKLRIIDAETVVVE